MNFGRCPTCGAPGKLRERRPDGNTTCENGHKHSSASFDRHQESFNRNREVTKANLEHALRVAGIMRTETVTLTAGDVRWLLAEFFA